MPTIDARVNGRVPDHVRGSDAVRDVREVYEQQDSDPREIRDATAVTVASWWQSPGPVGRHFATLASTGQVDRDSLLSDIRATRPEAKSHIHRVALDCLATWALAHPSVA